MYNDVRQIHGDFTKICHGSKKRDEIEKKLRVDDNIAVEIMNTVKLSNTCDSKDVVLGLILRIP